MASHTFDNCPQCSKSIPKAAKACHHCGWSSVVPTPVQIIQPQPPPGAQIVQHQLNVTKDSTTMAGDTFSRATSSMFGTCGGLTMFLVFFFVGLPILFCVGCNVLAAIGGNSMATASDEIEKSKKIRIPTNRDAALAAARASVPANLYIPTDTFEVTNFPLKHLTLRSLKYEQGDGFMSSTLTIKYVYNTPSISKCRPSVKAFFLNEEGGILGSSTIISEVWELEANSIETGSEMVTIDEIEKLAVIAIIDESKL